MTTRIGRSLIAVGICAMVLLGHMSSTAAPAKEPPQPLAKPNDAKFGVGMVPYMDGGYFGFDAATGADKTERMLYRIVGEMPEIDRMYVTNDGEHMLQTLMKLKNMGRKIDYLVLAGHGSKDRAGIKWGKDDMIPEEVDIRWTDGQLRIANGLMKDPSKSDMKPHEIRKRRDALYARSGVLHHVGHVMAPNAVVLLINCSAAATPAGEKFVKSLGVTLLGKCGGTIIASRTDISLYDVNWYAKGIGYLIRQWKLPSWNETLVYGDWVTYRVPPGAKRWDLVGVVIDPHKYGNGPHIEKDDYGKELGSEDYTFERTAFKIHSTLWGGDWTAEASWQLPEYILEGIDADLEIECKGTTPTKPGMKCRLSAYPSLDPYHMGDIYVKEVWHDGVKNAAISGTGNILPRSTGAEPNVGGWTLDTDVEPVRVALGHEVITSSKASYRIMIWESKRPEFGLKITGGGVGVGDAPLVIATYRMAKEGTPPLDDTPAPPKPAPAGNKPAAAANTKPKPSTTKPANTASTNPKPSTGKPAKPTKPAADTDVAPKADDPGLPPPPGAEADGDMPPTPPTPPPSAPKEKKPEAKQVPVAFGTWSPTKMEIKGIAITLELENNLWVATKVPGPVMETGSVLMKVDGKMVGPMSPEQIRDLIVGKPGTQVEFLFHEPKSGRLTTTGYVRR